MKEKEAKITDVPEGSVQVFSSRGRTQFYLNKDGDVRYMKSEEHPLVEQLCQKDYDQKVLSTAKKELQTLEKLKKQKL